MKRATLAIDYVDNQTEHKIHLPISVFKKPENEKEYNKLEKLLDTLMDEVRDDENHPLALAMEIIGDNLEQYDNTHALPIGFEVNEIHMVKHLMESHQLYQVDLADIFGGQANVSKFLNGERPLSKKQILGLKNKFHISADVFIK